MSFRNLVKRFGDKTAVDIPSFEIKVGEIIGLVGNNGAGKTTLFRLCLDLVKADNGEVNINGFNPAKSEDWKDFTGAYIDEGFLIDFLTPEEYFEFVGSTNNLSTDEVKQRLEGFHRFMGEEILTQKKLIRNYSAGNKQKVGIGAAMLHHPSLLILDEPFNFLDPSSQIILKELLEEYNRSTGATILVSSHNLQHIVDISSRIALLENGHIVKDLTNNDHQAKQELENYFAIQKEAAD